MQLGLLSTMKLVDRLGPHLNQIFGDNDGNPKRTPQK
jgi:hypothetical protein